MERLSLALLQMPVQAEKAANLLCVEQMLHDAKKAGADMAILPEMWNVPYQTDLFPHYAEEEGGATYQAMAHWAKTLDMVLIGGSIPEKDGDRTYSTAYAFDRTGELLTKHRKWHLFDIDIHGGQYFKESDTLSAGDGATIFDALGWRIGLGICFDVRFPMQAEAMATAGAELLIYPAAFNPTTGPLHWDLLFRARAVDCQAWSIGVAQACTEGTYQSWGHSLVVDPWGKIQQQADQSPMLLMVTVDKETVYQVRQQIPIGRKMIKS